MNIYDVKLTPQAEKHLREIIWHIAVELYQPEAAENLLNDFDEEFIKLGKNPEKHPLVDEEPWRSEEVRRKKIKHFIIYFWIDVEHAAVQVIGIVYERRDQKKFLKKLNRSN